MEFNVYGEMRGMKTLSDAVGLCKWNNESWTSYYEDSDTRVCPRILCCIQGDSKRWTHFLSLYGLNSKRRLNTRQTVGCGIPSSLLALLVDLRGLRSKLSSIRLTFSSDTRGRPELLPLHRQPYLLKLVIPTANALPCWEVVCWNEDETLAVQQSPTRF